MELKLNVYKADDNRVVEKTYTTDTYDLMYSTLEDLAGAIDTKVLSSANKPDKVEVGKVIISLLPQIKPLLRGMFAGITDEEIRRTKVKELVPVFVEAFTYAFDQMKSVNGNNEGN